MTVWVFFNSVDLIQQFIVNLKWYFIFPEQWDEIKVNIIYFGATKTTDFDCFKSCRETFFVDTINHESLAINIILLR